MAGREALIGNGPGKLIQPDQAYLRRLGDKRKARAIAAAPKDRRGKGSGRRTPKHPPKGGRP